MTSTRGTPRGLGLVFGLLALSGCTDNAIGHPPDGAPLDGVTPPPDGPAAETAPGDATAGHDVAVPDAAPLGEVTQLTRFGITWTFDHAVPYGEFINGDYWVIGPVTVTAIDPAPVPTGGVRNGFEVNPTPGDDQPYDDRAAGFNATLVQPLPLALASGAALVATISNPEDHVCDLDQAHPGWLNFQGDCYVSPIKTAAVLTVLAAPPPAGSFRPPYTGTDRRLYSGLALRDDLLTDLAPTAGAPDMAAQAERLARVRLDHKEGWSGADLIPIDSVGGYGAGMVRDLGLAGLRLLTSGPAVDKHELLIQFVQTGIDLFGTMLNGGYWPADGGHGSGRKFPILFAGLMLDDADMLAIGTTHGDGETFQEDCTTYYDDDAGYAHFYGVLGMPRWGIRHCQDTTSASYNDETSGYRACCNSQSWVAQTLAMRLLRLEARWNHQAYFDYEDRWMQSEGNGYWSSNWADAMWQQYRPTVDTCHNAVRDRCSVACDPATSTLSGETGVDQGGGC